MTRLQRISRTIILLAMLVIIGKIVFSEPTKLPIGMADGTYISDCCGGIVLIDGRMTVGQQFVDYEIETDKIGAYVLTTYYVGVSNNELILDRNRYPLKLRLDDEHDPKLLQINGDGQIYIFQRN